MRPAASQQGRTPSQAVLNPSAPASASAIVAATPPVSTPFSNAAQNALSPHGPKSSPQQVRKSPAALASQPSAAAFNFDSPSTAAAMGALGIPAGFDVAFDNPASLDALDAALADDELLKRLDSILDLFAVSRILPLSPLPRPSSFCYKPPLRPRSQDRASLHHLILTLLSAVQERLRQRGWPRASCPPHRP